MDPLIVETMDRAREVAPMDRIRILTGQHLLGPFREALGELAPSVFMVEPVAKGTAPVLVWAAWCIRKEDPEAVLVSLHADHAIQPREAFHSLLREGADLARAIPALFTIAVEPTRPETGYGYIQPGSPLSWDGAARAFRVKRFVEKPNRETAREYVSAGYLWNSGIFLWKASVFLTEVEKVAPELHRLIPLLEAGKTEDFFREAPFVSVDEAVLERSSEVASLRATFQWDDVGAWEALARTRTPDAEGNVLLGRAMAVESAENIVLVEEGTAVLFGVEGLVVVRSGDRVLVARRDRTPELKSLLKALPPEVRDPEEP
jgi:mannose-1-phosphate guanylyltransferase